MVSSEPSVTTVKVLNGKFTITRNWQAREFFTLDEGACRSLEHFADQLFCINEAYSLASRFLSFLSSMGNSTKLLSCLKRCNRGKRWRSVTSTCLDYSDNLRHQD